MEVGCGKKMDFEELAETEGYFPGEQVVGNQLRTFEGLTEHRLSSSGIETVREATKTDVWLEQY